MLMKRHWSKKRPSKLQFILCLPYHSIPYSFWRTYNDHVLSAEQQASQLATLRAAYAAGLATLEKLERTNVYNDAFCIGHDGVFGTINGLRLGRVPGVPVCTFKVQSANARLTVGL